MFPEIVQSKLNPASPWLPVKHAGYPARLLKCHTIVGIDAFTDLKTIGINETNDTKKGILIMFIWSSVSVRIVCRLFVQKTL